MSEAAMIIVPTDISTMVREVETAYNRYLNEFRVPEDHKIVVNFSAGTDSTTTATIAHNLFGDRAQFVMADTDNEHELTVDFAYNIHRQIGCEPVKVVKKIYSESDFERRRQSLINRWPKRQVIRMGAYSVYGKWMTDNNDNQLAILNANFGGNAPRMPHAQNE